MATENKAPTNSTSPQVGDSRVTLEDLRSFEKGPFLVYKGTIKGTTHDPSVGMNFSVTLPETHLVVRKKDGTVVSTIV